MDVKKESIKPSVVKKATESIIKKFPLSALSYPAHFAVAFLLSRAIILGAAAPFGLAASAVLSKKGGAVFALIGAAIGYLSVIDNINSLKYIACIILIYTAHFVFSDTSLSKSRLFSPVATAIPIICINLVFLADAGFPLFDSALSVLELTLALLCTVLFSFLTAPRRTGTQFIAGLLSLFAALTVSMCDFRLFNTFSLGRAIAYTLVLLCSNSGGLGTGAMVGTVLGFSVAAAEASPDYCMLYSMLGVISAAGSFNKYVSCISATAFTLFLSVCLNPSSLLASSAELFVSSLLFFPLAEVFSQYTRRFFIKNPPRSDRHIRSFATQRLNLAASTFRSLAKLLTDSQQRATASAPSNEQYILERTTRDVCKKCTLSDICWKRDFEATMDAVSNAQKSISENGILTAKDFPIHFSSRCLHIEEFVSTVNREIFAARYRMRFDKKLRESRELITKQYSDASAIFSAISDDISDNARFDEEAEIRLRDLLASRGILCDTAVYRDNFNRINIHLCGKDLSQIVGEYQLFHSRICEITNVKMGKPEYTNGEKLDDIVIREKPRFRAIFGAAVKQRRGSEISGDSGSFFQPTNGHLALLLSDGMGSGRLAARESAVSVALLEDLLKSGISPQSALETLQSALMLKSEYTGAFATLDLMYTDMFTGVSEFYKFGGAPTYIKRGHQLRRISSSSLPAGISASSYSSPDKTVLTLCEGDFVIMVSDGVSDGTDDSKLCEFLSQSDEASPKALADSLLAYSLAVSDKNDDMTVAVIQLVTEE